MKIKPIIYKKAAKFMRIFVLFIFLFSFLYPQGANADSISDKRRELEAIQQKIDAQSRILSKKTQERKTLANQVAIMNGQIAQTQYSINKTQLDISLTEAEIAKLKEQIKLKKKELAYQKEILNETLREVYTETDKGFLEVLFSTDNISEVFDNTEYLGAIESKISLTMDEINKIKTALNGDKKEQETKKTALIDKNSELQEQKNGLSTQQYAKNQVLNQTRGQEVAYQALLTQQQKAWENSNAELKQMEAALYTGGADLGPGYKVDYWPIYGRITAQYGACGCDAYLCGKCHTGIDIAAAFGTSVRAAKSGVVKDVVKSCADFGPWGCGGGYGNRVIIEHSDGHVTIYAHLKRGSVRVSVGQSVNGGSTVVGSEGSSGYSTGPHLHFEVRNRMWGSSVRPVLP